MLTSIRSAQRLSWRGGILLTSCLVLVNAVPARSAAAARTRDTAPAARAAVAAAVPADRAERLLAEAPVAFEENRGQADPRARFVARVAGGTAFVAPSEVGIVLAGSSRQEGVAMRLRYLGASGAARVEGEGRLPGVVNHLRGADPSRWLTDVPTYSRARVRGLYPGVDLVYYGADHDRDAGRLEYDLVVAPGADPSAVRFAVDGAERVEVDASTGDLVLGAGEHAVRLKAPALYQPSAEGRRAVSGRYLVRGAEVRFDVGEFDRSLPLVIDPIIYSTYVGGSATELFDGVAVDAAGNAYLVGSTFSADYPTTAGAFQGDQPDDDVVVTKLAPAGNAAVYSTYIGGDAGDFGAGIAIDAAGNAYVTGLTFSTNYPTLNGFATNLDLGDGFVTVLNSTGTALLYSTYLGGSGADTSVEIAVEAGGIAYVTGGTESPNFPTTANAFQPTRTATGLTTFVSKINTTQSGTASLVYSTYLGDLGQGMDVAVGAAGVVYVTGQADGAAFPTTAGAFQGDQPGADAFVSKLDTNASGAASLVYSTYLGGNATDAGLGIAVDAAGNAHVAGKTQSTNFPTTGTAFQPAPPGSASGDLDAFATRLNAGGTGLLYSTYLGGSADDTGTAIALDGSGAMNVVGETFSTDFPLANPIHGNRADSDAFASRVDPAGTGAGSLLASTYLGGNGADSALSVAADGSNNLYVVGFTSSTDFPVLNPFQADRPDTDAFATKLTLMMGGGVGGTDTVGVYDPATGAFFLRNSNSPGGADVVFTFGGGGATPISGDWDGDGDDTIGLYVPATGAVFLRNSNSSGGADIVFTFGGGGALVPLVGDWNGDGTDTIGLYDPATGAFFLRNSNSSGGADIVFTFGGGGALVPLRGDWNGDGTDTIGLYDPATGAFFLRNSNSPGGADVVFTFGGGGATPITGDWDGDGDDTIGLYIDASATWFLRNSNSPGGADLAFSYGPANFEPLGGDWDGN